MTKAVEGEFNTFFAVLLSQEGLQHSPRGVLVERCSENKSNFIKVLILHECSPLSLLYN